MAEDEIGLNDKSVEASMRRFNERMKSKVSTAGMIAHRIGTVDKMLKEEEKKQADTRKTVPDAVTVTRIFGIPFKRTEIKLKTPPTPQPIVK